MAKDEEVIIAIKEAAKRVFLKWGFNKTTMEDIAREAGKGKSTLYYYFKSKEELFENIAIDEFNNILITAKTAVDKIDSPKDKLKKHIATTFAELKKTVSIHSLIKGEVKENKRLKNNILKRFNNSEEAIILGILELGLKLNEFNFLKDTELKKAANVILGIKRGLELSLLIENEDSEKMDIAMRLIAEGL